jgi:two-component system nitrate/nitrite response regulator NarL
MPHAERRPGRIRILLVDDHRVFADVLAMRLRLETGVEHVEVATTLEQARVLARRLQPHLVLLDYDVGGEPGPQLVPELQKASPPPGVLMLSGQDSAESIVEALRAGASGWVVKGSHVEDLLAAAQEVVRGNLYVPPERVGSVLRSLLEQQQPEGSSTPSFVDQLSARQRDVLRCLVAGMSRAETAARLYITPNTVRTHVQHLLRAADAHSTPQLVARARKAGVTGIDDDTSSA